MATLVTGGSGFIGSAIIRQLLDAGHEVRALVRPESDCSNLEGLPIDTVIGDLEDAASLERAVMGCDVLFHAAADYRLWVRDPARMYDVNVTGTLNIMQAALAAGVGRIVYTSSVATLGLSRTGAVVDEDSPSTLPEMVGHYKRSKFLAEGEVLRLVASDGLPAVIVCPTTPVGPRDIKPTPTGRIIIRALSGRMPAYVDTGLNLVHVDDVARGHLLALERGRIGERYIIGAQNMSLRDILQELSSITGQPPPRFRLPHNLVLPFAYAAEAWAAVAGSGEPFVTVAGVRMAKRFMFFSTDKAQRELAYAPGPVQKALSEAVEWFQRHGRYSAR